MLFALPSTPIGGLVAPQQSKPGRPGIVPSVHVCTGPRHPASGGPLRQRIDSHHHLWHYTAEEYGWIDDSQQVLRRDFLLDDLSLALRSAHVDGTVAVQARQTVEETHWLLELADSGSPILGVVGWLPLADPAFESTLAPLLSSPKLKGVRHVVQAEPPGFLDREDFNRGVGALRKTGLVYDILIFSNQLQEATRFVDRHPAQSFVLDHIAKPGIRAGEIAVWSAGIRELARRPNIVCKLSGMITEADPANWTHAQLTPYFQIVLEAFGPQRLMIGSDWPVLTTGCSYAQWWQTVEQWILPLTSEERAQILGETAIRVYRLPVGQNVSKQTSVTEQIA